MDVGANVGQYGEKVRSLGYRGPIVSFEPQRLAFAQLARVAARDGDWTCRKLAITDTPGEDVPLFNSENSVSSSLLEVREEHVAAAPTARALGHELVSARTLDLELETIDPGVPVWLKLDVQGHELPALRGGKVLLERCRVVQIELSFSELYKGQALWLEVCQELADAGFLLRYMEPGFEDPHTGILQQADALFARPEVLPQVLQEGGR